MGRFHTWAAAPAAAALLALAFGLLTAAGAWGQGLPDPPSQETAVEFLVNEAGGVTPRKGTAWKVQYARGLHKGVYLTGAWFKRDLAEDWIKVIHDARPAELFVPYHESTFTRYFDLTGFSFPMAEVKAEDAGPNGAVMPAFQGDAYPTVVREVRDRGVAWKDYSAGVRRGREMVLWGALQAGNYVYILQYGFQDDGTVTFRVGATGQNLPGQRTQAHMHNCHWRVDVDVADGAKNSAMLMTHTEATTGLTAADTKEPFNSGVEGGVDWEAKEFTMVRVESEMLNANGKKVAYDLMPMRQGSARHKEAFTHHDLYVSRSHPERPAEMLFANVPAVVRDQEGVENADVVLWYTSSSHHEPRDEDGKGNVGRRLWRWDDGWEGSALVMWSGFDLRPRNLFDRTPFYPYTPVAPVVPRPDDTAAEAGAVAPTSNAAPAGPGR